MKCHIKGYGKGFNSTLKCKKCGGKMRITSRGAQCSRCLCEEFFEPTNDEKLFYSRQESVYGN
jgi:hypothetical protein